MRVRLEYTLNNQNIVFYFNQDSDFISLHVNGKDLSHNCESIEHALAVIAEAGIKIDKDISLEIHRQRRFFESSEGISI
jgi:hypothetical protein